MTIDEREVIEDVELHLLNEWHLRCAREHRREKARRQVARFVQDVMEEERRTRPSVLHLWLASVVLLALSVVILYWS